MEFDIITFDPPLTAEQVQELRRAWNAICKEHNAMMRVYSCGSEYMAPTVNGYQEGVCFCCGGKDTYLTPDGMSSIFCGMCGWREGDHEYQAKPSNDEIADKLYRQRADIIVHWRYDDTHDITQQGEAFIKQIDARLAEIASVTAP